MPCCFGQLRSCTDAAYSQNDLLVVLSPPSSGPPLENNKQAQTQYDGLGRPTSLCAISSTVTGNVLCGQATNTSATGVLTTTSYSTSSSGSQTVSSTRGVQIRSSTVDGLGRITSSITPEGGTTQYFWDSGPDGCGFPVTGTLSEKKDNAGLLVTCYYYDSLGRYQSTYAGRGSSSPLCSIVFYDSLSTSGAGTPPVGYVAANIAGRVMEASTNNCTAGPSITDEWFSYDADGHLTDVWQSTPHSGGYYHSTATYFANGQLSSLSIPGLGTVVYTVDGEGRPNKATKGTLTLVSGVTYSPLGVRP
jgi:hypothetical protein